MTTDDMAVLDHLQRTISRETAGRRPARLAIGLRQWEAVKAAWWPGDVRVGPEQLTRFRGVRCRVLDVPEGVWVEATDGC